MKAIVTATATMNTGLRSTAMVKISDRDQRDQQEQHRDAVESGDRLLVRPFLAVLGHGRTSPFGRLLLM